MSVKISWARILNLAIKQQFHYLKRLTCNEINLSNYPNLVIFNCPFKKWTYKTIPLTLQHITIGIITEEFVSLSSKLLTFNFGTFLVENMTSLNNSKNERTNYVMQIFNKHHKNSYLVDFIHRGPMDLDSTFLHLFV